MSSANDPASAGGGGAATAEPVLAVRGLHVHRGEAHILQGVDLDVAPRQVTALLGRNGAGKTTTLLALLGLLPSRGEIVLDGEDVAGLPTYARALRGIAYVPEDREVFTQLTVAENLRLAMRGAESEQRLPLVHEVFPELERRTNQRAGTLSGGQQQMLALGRALLQPAQLLLIDEPTKGLAPIVIAEVVAALEELSSDTTVLLVEQNLRVAERLATDAFVLDHGRVAWRGAVADLLADAAETQRLLGVSGGGGSGRPGGDGR